MRPAPHIVTLRLNGEEQRLAIEPRLTLLEALRDLAGLTGTKAGCDKGDCGACTVLMNGAPILSCLTLAIEAEGAEITTIEGVAQGARPHPVQDAFDEKGALQCGFCQPGMILSAVALLQKVPTPERGQIRAALAGNLCRCTGYTKIVEAVEHAARKGGGAR